MAGNVRLTQLSFRAGARRDDPGLQVEVGSVVMLVGPNNSGKSLALREIRHWCSGQPNPSHDGLVIADAAADTPTDVAAAKSLLAPFGLPVGSISRNQMAFQILAFGDGQSRSVSFGERDLENATSRSAESVHIRQLLVDPFTVHLDGATRFHLSESQQAAGLRGFPQNHFVALLKDPSARRALRDMGREAFGLFPVIDCTAMTKLVMRLSEEAPPSDEEESVGERAREFFSGARPLDEFSDGVKSFVGILSAVLSMPFSIVLIDDPEAFLHPPHARLLGRFLSRLVAAKKGSLVASTHSSEFLIGCLEEAIDASVVRLTYQQDLATARALARSEIEPLMRDPLLRSTEVLSGLFHRGAVITEADSDRAFYEELNRRLLADNRGIADALFSNAQNAQTVARLVGPLRRIGVPAAALVDLDFVAESDGNWESLLGSCLVPESVVWDLRQERAWLNSVLPERDTLKRSGVERLDAEDKRRAYAFLSRLSEYGLFLVPVGEMESWFPAMNISGHGSQWLVRFFSQIGSTASESGYLRPTSGRVWDFIDRVAGWISNPGRLGT